MCGRYVLTTNDYAAVADAFEAEYDEEDAAAYRPRFNIAPTDTSIVLRGAPGRRRRLARATWGLVSPRDKDKPKPPIQINARAETVGERGMFRRAFERQRVGVVADGFYEWTGPKNDRRPIRFHRPDGRPFVFAGIASPWTHPVTGEVTTRFAIITTTANQLVAPVHDRMPVVLDTRDIDAWIGDAPTGAELEGSVDAWLDSLRGLLVPANDGVLVATPASPRVGDVRNDDPSCLDAPPTLF
jgi:putative SOS response-associated peptidase YedK